MSRSYKKNPVSKFDVQVTKPQASRKLRRINKIRIQKDLEPLVEDEVINKYDLYDYRMTNFPGEESYDEKWNYIKRK